MEYIGEHLLPGKIGNAFVIVSFVAALVAAVSYFFAAKDNPDNFSWRKLARIAFRLHSVSVIGIMATLFFMIYNHMYEYEYVWHHSSNDLEMKFIFSCFWEGQEGSFLLWTLWHVVIGNILIRTSKEWEAPVMATVSFVQVFLASMLLGVNILGYHSGSNPFTVLLRTHPDYANLPFISNPHYLEKLDGRGLNLLLRNYWMTIHPPTLFLGFALTVVPFAYAIAGLWKKRLNDWQKPALPWTYVGVAVLGLGILMGGAWAYEALSFGGFWAWDPVENASLVPWLTLAGAAHVMLINKNKGTSLGATFFLVLLTFILILYSTFLTRSGILGETSVHAFTDLGMSAQLLCFLFFFLYFGFLMLLGDFKLKLFYSIASVVILITSLLLGYGTFFLVAWFIISLIFLGVGLSTSLPKEDGEEAFWSREFWMFVGALVLLISSFQIMYSTSIPVWNKLFDMHKAPPSDPFAYYHPWQISFAFIITLLMGVAQFLKYKKSDPAQVGKRLLMPILVTVILTVLISLGLHIDNLFYSLLLLSSLFAVSANATYLIRVLNGNVKNGGAAIAHIGFALVLLGVLLSTSKKEFISFNNSGTDIESLDKKLSNSKNILLDKGDTLKMGEYFVTYKGKHRGGETYNKSNIYFGIDYLKKNNKGQFDYQFTLEPFVQQNPRMGNSAEPGTKHFLTRDIYTHVTFADMETPEEKQSSGEYSPAQTHTIGVGDTIFSSNGIIVFDKLDTDISKAKYDLGDKDIAVGAKLSIHDINRKTHYAEPLFIVHNSRIEPLEANVDELGLKFVFWKIHPETGKVDITLSEKTSNAKDFVVMEAIIFPYINVLWMGCIIMIIGTLIAVWRRIRK